MKMKEPCLFLQRLGVIVFVVMLCLAQISCSKMGESEIPPSDVTDEVPSSGGADEVPSPGGAVKGLKTNWKEEMLYQHPLVYPAYLSLDDEGNTIIVSRGNNEIVKLLPGGSFLTYADISSLSNVKSIGYQSGLKRLLITTGRDELFAFSNGELTILKKSGVPASSIAVNSVDDTFYTCSQARNSKIYHYDANGKRLSTIASGVDGCFQLALDETNNKLYYSETYAGRVTELDLSDKSKKIIATGVGIPGTFEPIAVALDGENTLYYFTANQGLIKYDGGTTTKVMDSISGVGPMIYSPVHSAFLVGNGVGANIISYDPYSALAEHLTPYTNAIGIVETDDGTVLVCDESFGGYIQRVDSVGFTPFTKDLVAGESCWHLERDSNGNIYAGMTDGSIWKIAPDGSATSWVSGYSDDPVVSLHYDSKNNAIVSFTGNHFKSTATIWRIPFDTPEEAIRVMELSDVRITDALPAGAVDNLGNIYVLERTANVIYKISDGASTATTFASNVLDHDAITVPRMEYLSREDALLVSTIGNYELWPLGSRKKSTFATNNGGVDNFGINETKNGDLIAIHSGRVFRFIYSPDS